MLLVGFLVIPPLASLLDQAVPPVSALVVAMLAAPAVIAADALHKRYRRRRRTAHG